MMIPRKFEHNLKKHKYLITIIKEGHPMLRVLIKKRDMNKNIKPFELIYLAFYVK